ncbi:MAG: response regulator transcription factor [Terriglobales bacterium]
MESKLSPVLDDQMESGVNGLPRIALGKHDRQDLSSAVALLEETIMPLSGGDIPLQFRPAEWLKSDNYQVALVPLGNEADREGKNSQAPREMKPVIVLPLTWRELVVRLRAGVGPWGSGRESSVIRFGEVFANFSSMEVSRSEENVALTTMEFKLLRFLVQNAGRAISRDEMLNEVWGYEHYPCTRTVDNHILRLRQKLELDPAHPVHFHTVHGVGYKFVLESSPVVAEHRM